MPPPRRSRPRAVAPRTTPLALRTLPPLDPDVLAPEADIEDGEVADSSWDDLDLAHANVRGARLVALRAQRIDLTAAHLGGTALERLDAPAVRATRGGWRDVELTGSRLGSLEAYESTWDGVRIEDCRLGYVNLRGATLTDVLVTGTSLDELDLVQATVRRAAFEACRIGRLDVQQATLEHVDLRGAQVDDVVGVESLRGIVVTPAQLVDLAAVLARALGVVVAGPGEPIEG